MSEVDKLAEEMAARKPVCCHKCNEPFSLSLIAKAAAESRISFRLKPAKGEKMDLGTVAGSWGAVNKLLRSIAKDLGMKAIVLIDRLETGEEGELEVHLLICRSQK